MYPYEQPLTKDQEAYLKRIYYDQHFQYGREKLYQYTRNQKEVPRIYRKQIEEWLKRQKVHAVTTKPQKQTSTRPTRASKSSILQLDLMDMSGTPSNRYKYILNVIDIFSRYVWSFPLRDKLASTVKKHVQGIITKYPNFKVMQTDQGNEFNFDIPNVTHLRSTAYTPQSQGVVERFNGTLRSQLRRYFQSSGKNDWSAVLEKLVNNYNITVSTVTKDTPKNILEKYNGDQIKELNERQEQKFKARHKQATDTLLTVGTKVRVINQKRVKSNITDKSLPFWNDTIYTITKVIKANPKTLSRNRYKVDGLPNTYNLTQLQVVADNEDDAPNRQEPKPTVKGRVKNKRIEELNEGVRNTLIMS